MVEKEVPQDQETAPIDESLGGLIPFKVGPIEVDSEKLKKMLEGGRIPQQGRGGRCGGCDIRSPGRPPGRRIG